MDVWHGNIISTARYLTRLTDTAPVDAVADADGLRVLDDLIALCRKQPMAEGKDADAMHKLLQAAYDRGRREGLEEAATAAADYEEIMLSEGETRIASHMAALAKWIREGRPSERRTPHPLPEKK